MSREWSNDLYYSISLTVVEAATNSASIVDKETDICFFDPQDTFPWSNMMIKPEMDFLST